MFWNHLLKYVILLTISVILVAGFWFHSTFYQYGFLPLLAVGGIVTLLIIVVTSRTLAVKPLFRPRAKGSLEFSEKDKDAIVNGRKRLHVIPFRSGKFPRLNTLCAAESGGERFARLYITDVQRMLASDFAEGELAPAGFGSAEEFWKSLGNGAGTGRNDMIYVILFDCEAMSGGG